MRSFSRTDGISPPGGGRNDARGPALAAEFLESGTGQKRRRKTAGQAGFFEKRQQFGRPEFIDLAPERVCAVVGRQAQAGGCGSTSTSRCTVQVSMGETPGINHPSRRCAQWSVGIWPETAQSGIFRTFRSADGRNGWGRTTLALAKHVEHLKKQRSGAGPPGEGGVGRPVEISHPHGQDMRARPRSPRHREIRAKCRFSRPRRACRNPAFPAPQCQVLN